MTDKQIIIEDYFNIMRDDYGRIYCIQDIGDPKELIKAIREQNEYIQRKEQECEFSNLKIIQLQETLSQYETDLSTKDCIVETCKAQCKELKAENEWLKEEFINKNEKIKELRFSVSDLTNRLCDLNAEKSFKIVDLEQALTEIKEIAYELTNEEYTDFIEGKQKQIIQICDEVNQCENQ